MAVLFHMGNFLNIKVYCADYCVFNAQVGAVLLIKNIVKRFFSKVMRKLYIYYTRLEGLQLTSFP